MEAATSCAVKVTCDGALYTPMRVASLIWRVKSRRNVKRETRVATGIQGCMHLDAFRASEIVRRLRVALLMM
jgi:hypothetical protein